MAKLRSGDLILEINFDSFEEEWIAYKIKFSWKDTIIVNDSILKRTGEFGGKRPYGTFLANDYEKDQLIDTIKKVLDTNEPDYWEPVEPDIVLAIYPDTYFPFMKSHWVLIDDGGMKQMEPEKGFTIITFIDTYNFENSDAYSGNGISLHLIVKRDDLENFVTELESEYKNLKLEHKDPEPVDVKRGAETIALSLDPSVVELILFLQNNGPKTDSEIVNGIPGFELCTLGKARELELIDSTRRLVWLTSKGESLAAVLVRLQRNF